MNNPTANLRTFLGDYSEQALLQTLRAEIDLTGKPFTIIEPYLQPDLELSDTLTLSDLVQPLTRDAFPDHELREYRWILTETMSGFEKLAEVSPVHAVYLACLTLEVERKFGQGASPAAPHAAGLLVCAAPHCSDPVARSVCLFLSDLAERYERSSRNFDEELPAICRLAAGAIFYQISARICSGLWAGAETAFGHFLLQREADLMCRRPWQKGATAIEAAWQQLGTCAETYTAECDFEAEA